MQAAGGLGDRLAHVRFHEVEGGGADADEGDRRRIDQRKQAAQPVADRFAGLAVGVALRTVGGARAGRQRQHVVRR